jgi:hypothetical protein
MSESIVDQCLKECGFSAEEAVVVGKLRLKQKISTVHWGEMSNDLLTGCIRDIIREERQMRSESRFILFSLLFYLLSVLCFLDANVEAEDRLVKKLKAATAGENINVVTDSEYAVYWEQEVGLSICQSLDIPHSPSVLAHKEHLRIVNQNCNNEHKLVVCLTSKMEELSRDCGLVFVNSEENKWVHSIRAS